MNSMVADGGTMTANVIAIAAECFKDPVPTSIWSPKLNKYVCLDSAEGQETLSELTRAHLTLSSSTISPQFKWVFMTAVGGTLLFIVLCLVLSLIAGKQPPPLFEKVILGFFDMAKIGFGALVGMLCGKELQGPMENRGACRMRCSYRIDTAPDPSSSRLTSFKSTGFDSPANNVGSWPASLGCTKSSYSSINPSSVNASGSFTPPTNRPLPRLVLELLNGRI